MIRNIFWILITFILAPFFYTRILINRLFKNKQLKILVIATSKIGDLTCSTPVFRTLKERFPKSYLVVGIREQSYGVVRNNPNIDKFIFINSEKYQGFLGKIRLVREISKERFTWSINLGSYPLNTILPFWAGIPKIITTTSKFAGKTAKLFSLFNNHILEYKKREYNLRHNLKLLKFLGIRKFSEKKEVFVTETEKEKAREFLKKNNLKDLTIGISVTVGGKFRQWESVKFSQLADKLVEELGAKILFIGGLDDKKAIQRVINRMKNKAVMATGFKIHELAALFQELKLFIACETGPLHIAHAAGTPVVDIIGPVDIKVQPPPDKNAEIVVKDIYCVPCSFLVPPVRFCKEGHRRCLKDVTVDDVHRATIKLIKRVYENSFN